MERAVAYPSSQGSTPAWRRCTPGCPQLSVCGWTQVCIPGAHGRITHNYLTLPLSLLFSWYSPRCQDFQHPPAPQRGARQRLYRPRAPSAQAECERPRRPAHTQGAPANSAPRPGQGLPPAQGSVRDVDAGPARARSIVNQCRCLTLRLPTLTWLRTRCPRMQVSCPPPRPAVGPRPC
jgi:hypothetical protein